MAAANRHKLYRKAYIFLNCLLLSLVLWFLTTMNRVHTDRVKIPVRYTDLPEGMSVVNVLPEEVTVVIEARGFKLLANRMTTTWTPIEIKVDPNHEIARRHKPYFVLSLRNRFREIASQLGSDIRITEIIPDSILFQFGGRTDHKVPVRFNGALGFAPQYGLGGPPVFSPDSVIVSGGEKEIKNIDSVVTEFVNLSDLKSPYTRTVKLKTYPGCSYSSTQVQVSIPVEQLTEKELVLSVQPRKVPDSLEMKIIPEQVRLRVLVPLSQFQRITENAFTLTATYPDNNRMKSNKAIVRVETQPGFVRVIELEPSTVEYIIRIR